MSCCQPTPERIEEIRRSIDSIDLDFEMKDNVTELLRGGIVVKTKAGNVQVGMPPETIKDAMMQGLTMPNIFVIPTVRYSKIDFMNVAEFEFPAYFNFFILKKRMRIVCDKEQENSIRIIFQETLLGPKEFPNLDDEFNEILPRSYRPDFPKELGHMATNPVTGKKMVVETLLDFVNYNENSEAEIGEGVKIVRNSGFFIFEENGNVVAKVKDHVKLNKAHYYTSKILAEEKKELMTDKDQLDSNVSIDRILSPLGFTPPDFGVTVLGSSHGFDCKGSTSGYVFWINGRGVMVDPPPFSSQNLCEFGIPPNLIDKVILSHCHADHDSGLFQKILHSNVVELITTPTILGSFLRKYSALTGLPTQYFRELFNFRPVSVGSYIDLLGASFRFFYSFHAIPCIGFEVTYCGRSMYFSGDTFYDPDALQKLHHQGVFSKERLESLVDINWGKYDIILHEAGVPPIHTSTAVLREFPDHIKEKLYLVHIANEALPADSGLKVAKTGLKNTIILDVKVPIDSTIQKLDLLSSIEFLNEIPLTKARDLIRCSKVESYMPGQMVIKEGTYGNKFYIIMSGIAKIYSVNKLTPFSKYAYAGDYFGETSLIQDGKRNAK